MDATKTPIEPSLIARLTAGVKYIVGAKAPDIFMSPQEPMKPTVPATQQPSVEGRAFDYAVGFNQRVTPRQSEPVDFKTMRNLADGYDLMRLIIETRKDQIAKLDFTIKKTSGDKIADARCEAVQEFFKFPDKENNWNDWLRMLVEEMLVIDAATIYPRKTRGGQLYALELIDGSTISRKLDAWGRTPSDLDAVAYQQVLKGMPAVDYTRDELHYAPRNKRIHKVYGYSPVEQVITTVNIALRRQLSQLQYYTEGSTPDLIMTVPVDWTPEQVAKFQVGWNAALKGNMGERAGAKFVPNGVQPFNTKDAMLKDEFDDWLARVMCFAFSISPSALVKATNKATAQSNQDVALQEGLEPIMAWVKGVIDALIFKYFGYSDVEFSWVEETDVDPKTQAEINQIYLVNQVLTPDEVREDIGREVLTPEERTAAFPPPPVLSADNGLGVGIAEGEKTSDSASNTGDNSGNEPNPAEKMVNVVVNMPKQPDVYVDIGATTITAKFDTPAGEVVNQTVKATRQGDGSLQGSISKV